MQNILLGNNWLCLSNNRPDNDLIKKGQILTICNNCNNCNLVYGNR